jgi:serine/threonine protein phosphatase PrpC
MPLYIDTGHSSSRGDRSEKSCLIVVPDSEHQAAHGVLVAIADGLPEHANPESAAHDTLKALGQAFYATPENWSLGHALQESVFAANKALLADRLDPGRASALSSLVLRGRRWTIAHTGHTRVWLVRDSKVKVLTHDHVEPRVQRAPRVTRACGLVPNLEAEFVSGELRENDVFILTTAGIHNVLTGAQILACVMLDMTAAQMASLVMGKAGGNTGSSVCAVRVEQLPAESQADIEEDITALPPVAPPDIGSEIDGFRIERLVHKSSRYRLYKAIDIPSGKVVALKFPNPRDADNNPGFAERFLREEWIGRRVSSAHLVRTLALKKGRRTVLYSVMEYPRGESLAKALARKGTLGVRASIFTGAQLLEALSELHDQGIIHNDIRPQNIVIDKRSKNLMLLGLGGGSHMTRTTSGTETSSGARRGSFLAPELFEQEIEPTVRTDIFAAGVTIYRMLSGTYPYGKIMSNGQAPQGAYVPVTTYCTEASPELDDALRRACALDPDERFESAHEFVQTLEQSVAQSNLSNTRAKPNKASSRSKWELVLVGALLLGLLAYIVLSF